MARALPCTTCAVLFAVRAHPTPSLSAKGVGWAVVEEGGRESGSGSAHWPGVVVCWRGGLGGFYCVCGGGGGGLKSQ